MSDRPTRAPIRTTWGIRLSGLVRRTLVIIEAFTAPK
jgi:hypothetical protein